MFFVCFFVVFFCFSLFELYVYSASLRAPECSWLSAHARVCVCVCECKHICVVCVSFCCLRDYMLFVFFVCPCFSGPRFASLAGENQVDDLPPALDGKLGAKSIITERNYRKMG